MCDITALNVTLLCQNTSGKWSLCSPIWFSKTSLGDSILRDPDGALVFWQTHMLDLLERKQYQWISLIFSLKILIVKRCYEKKNIR